jgi:gliding motility-associated lipoprotein GldD
MLKRLTAIVVVLIFLGCQGDYTPKPRGYFRIDLPEKEYQPFTLDFPYAFEYPVYSELVPDTRATAEPYWANLVFPQFKGVVHLSYKSVRSQDDLAVYFEDARTFVNKHIPKATAFHDHVIMQPGRRVFGMYHEIRGSEAASTVQFYVTDSLNHFLRGALYFNVTPNNDSLAPVITFIQEDIRHMLSTLEWQ